MSREPTEIEIRVAKRLAAYEGWHGKDHYLRYLNRARAAIRAMYEPTIEMINEGMMTFTEAECMSDDGVTIGASEGDDPFEAAWKEMIDVASPEDE